MHTIGNASLSGFIYVNRWYYGYNEEHLPACTLNVHAMLHIAMYIRHFGPAWTTWQFPMERYCGKLGARITSQLHPYATLSNYVTRTAQVAQLKACYPPVLELLSNHSLERELANGEVVYASCDSNPFHLSPCLMCLLQISTQSCALLEPEITDPTLTPGAILLNTLQKFTGRIARR